MTTAETIGKIENTNIAVAQYLAQLHKDLETAHENHREYDRDMIAKKIRGSLETLCLMGVINRREMMGAYLYYTYRTLR